MLADDVTAMKDMCMFYEDQYEEAKRLHAIEKQELQDEMNELLTKVDRNHHTPSVIFVCSCGVASTVRFVVLSRRLPLPRW